KCEKPAGLGEVSARRKAVGNDKSDAGNVHDQWCTKGRLSRCKSRNGG
ncbi:unnamed protein product, partial [Heterotrigona itama]